MFKKSRKIHLEVGDSRAKSMMGDPYPLLACEILHIMLGAPNGVS
jgi:hypothetical protein